jgi:rubrerythrin
VTKDIDFSSLDLMDALDLAALVEEEARERYEEFASQMEIHHTTDAAEFFRFMAANEAKHGRELEERRRALYGGAPRRVDRSMLWDEEAPAYETVHAFMTPREAMEVALDAERKAQRFFMAALAHVKDARVAALFEELHFEEVQHEGFVSEQLEKLPPSPRTDPEDYADPPVAH